MRTHQNITVKLSIIINTTLKLFGVLTIPDIIKQYLFESHFKTDWKVGNSISFSRACLNTITKPTGKIIMDKGQILEINPRKLLKFSFGTVARAMLIYRRIIQL